MFDINEKLQRHLGPRGALALKITLLLGTLVLCGLVGHTVGVDSVETVAATTTTAATATTTVRTTTTTWSSDYQSILVVNAREILEGPGRDQGLVLAGNHTEEVSTDIYAIKVRDGNAKQQLPGFIAAGFPKSLNEWTLWSDDGSGSAVPSGNSGDQHDIDDDSVTGRSYCSVIHENTLYILGHSAYFFETPLDYQISRINDDTCNLERVGTLPFRGNFAICTTTPNGIVVGFAGDWADEHDTQDTKKSAWRGDSPLTIDTELPKTSARHYRGAMASSTTQAIVVGSGDQFGASDEYTTGNVTELLDLTSWTWSTVASYPFASGDGFKYDAKCIHFDDDFLLMGGYHGYTSAYSATPSRRIDAYSPSTDTWRQVGQMLSPRRAPFSVRPFQDSDGDYMDIIGGEGALRSSEMCIEASKSDQAKNQDWDLDWWCHTINEDTEGDIIAGATHTIDVAAGYCMN
jgi:hypothetical protein